MSKRPIESVWDYPRPPRLEPEPGRIRVWRSHPSLGEVLIADSTRAHRVLETTHPPTYYLPFEDVRSEYLVPGRGSSHCEWKGQAVYHDLRIQDGGEIVQVPAIAWSYPQPTPPFARIRDALSFYPSKVTRCEVDGETSTAQAGDFYGGWINSWIDGGKRGFKGGPGTFGW